MIKYIESLAQKGYFSIVFITTYFVLNNVNNYFGLLPAAAIAKYSLAYLAFGLILFFAGFVFFKNKLRTALYSLLVMGVFFFFGAYHDFIKSIPFPKFFKSYTFNLPIIFLLLIITLFVIKKSNILLITRLNKYIFITLSILVAWQLLLLGYYFVTHRDRTGELGDLNKSVSRNYIPCDACKKPDIYFIVFDEFTSTKCLRDDFGYDNSRMDSFLIKRGFYIADDASSNYAFTFFSIPSTFDLGYLNHAKMREPLTAELRLRGIRSIYYCELTDILKKEGYIINNISGFDLKDNPAYGKTFFNEKPEQILPGQTLIGRIKKDIWWNFIAPDDSASYIKTDDVQKFRNAYIQKLDTLLHHKNSSKPSFTYCHIMLPHDPYYFDENGKLNDLKSMHAVNITQNRQLYLNQLRYTAKILETMVDTMMSATEGKSVIIIEGDHGFRNFGREMQLKKVYRNLSCYYFPDKDYSSLYKKISPVNTFRIVLNKFFKKKYPILPDSSFYINPGFANF